MRIHIKAKIDIKYEYIRQYDKKIRNLNKEHKKRAHQQFKEFNEYIKSQIDLIEYSIRIAKENIREMKRRKINIERYLRNFPMKKENGEFEIGLKSDNSSEGLNKN